MPDRITSTLLQNRLLIENIGRFEAGDKCNGSGCRLNADISDRHAMGCPHVGPVGRRGGRSHTHEVLRGLVHDLLSFSGVGFDPQDLTTHKGIIKRLKEANAIPLGVQGLHKGGDILSLNVMKEPGQIMGDEMALDVTVTSKLGTPQDPLSCLKSEEERKHGLYAPMYDKIGVDTVGLAMDTSGNMGPNLVKLIEKCNEFRGVAWANHLPPWSTWRCRTFKSAWVSRFVVTMQIAAASKLNYVAASVARTRARGLVLGDVG